MPIDRVRNPFTMLSIDTQHTVIQNLSLKDALNLSATAKETRALLPLHPQFLALSTAFAVPNTPAAVANHIRDNVSAGHQAELRARLGHAGQKGVDAVRVGALLGASLYALTRSSRAGDTQRFSQAMRELRDQVRAHALGAAVDVSPYQRRCLKALTQGWLTFGLDRGRFALNYFDAAARAGATPDLDLAQAVLTRVAPQLASLNCYERHEAVSITCAIYRALRWPMTQTLHGHVERMHADPLTLRATPANLIGEMALYASL